MTIHRFLAAGLCACTAALMSCSSALYNSVYPVLVDGKYDTEFPYRGCAKQLEEIGESVKMVSSVAYYRTYAFQLSERIRSDSLTEDFLDDRKDQSTFINRSLSGTATIIWAEGPRVALLTCAHIVAFPDTTVEYHLDESGHYTPFVRSVAVKERQMNFVGLLPEGGELEILAIDRKTDVAILGKTLLTAPVIPFPSFRFPAGHARELEWGSFVYLFGYPAGYRMVTKGIVSDPNRDKRGGFLVDAVFGGGFSGGLAMAIRDGVPNFELVGMVKMVPARSSYVLTPRRDDLGAEYDPTVPYHGNIYVERQIDIEYGITQAISIESIQEFIEQNETSLRARGYTIHLAGKPG